MPRRLGSAAAPQLETADANATRDSQHWRRDYLEDLLRSAREEAGAAAARFALLCRATDVSTAKLAASSAEAEAAAGRVRCFAVLLSRE